MTTDLCFECSNKDSILCSICGIAKDGAREHFNQKPITNADRIRSMSNEELADEILRWFNWLNAVYWDDHRIINWLREEYKSES